MKRQCPNCGGIDYGTPFCPSCQAPMGPMIKTGEPVDTGAGQDTEFPVLPGVLATVRRRFVALLVDDILIGLITIFITVLSGISFTVGTGSFPGKFWAAATLSASLKMIYFLVWLAYHTAFLGSTGQTPGKKILGLKVIRTGGERIGYARALGRTLGYIPSSLLYIGFMWAIWDRRKQAWHDKFVDSVVIKL